MVDYYGILGLSRGATEAEIKRAYRQYAMKYHPDRNPSAQAQEMFVKINEAYNFLLNPKNRDFLQSSKSKDPYYQRKYQKQRPSSPKTRSYRQPKKQPTVKTSKYQMYETKIVTLLAELASELFNWAIIFLGIFIISISWMSYFTFNEEGERLMPLFSTIAVTILGVSFVLGIRWLSAKE